MCANFGDPRSRDRKLGHQKPGKNGDFCVKNLLIFHNIKATKRGKLKFGHNKGANEGLYAHRVWERPVT